MVERGTHAQEAFEHREPPAHEQRLRHMRIFLAHLRPVLRVARRRGAENRQIDVYDAFLVLGLGLGGVPGDVDEPGNGIELALGQPQRREQLARQPRAHRLVVGACRVIDRIMEEQGQRQGRALCHSSSSRRHSSRCSVVW